MNVTIRPGALRGSVRAIPAKADVQRLLIAAALSEQESRLPWKDPSADMRATLRCLRALGAEITEEDGFCTVRAGKRPKNAELDCGESGATLRFLLPVTAALGVHARLTGQGRLPSRPQGPLLEALRKNGCRAEGEGLPLTLDGGLHSGEYSIPGSVSSQFVTGLLFALPLLEGDSRITLTSPLESAPYVEMTLSTLTRFGVRVERLEDGYLVPGGQSYKSPGTLVPEGDWSAAAFWLCAGALGGDVEVTGLNMDSAQGDKAVLTCLAAMGAQVETHGDAARCRGLALRPAQMDIRQTPDLGPVLALTAAFAQGETRMDGVRRLRFKESDRLAAIQEALKHIGVRSETDGETLFIHGGAPQGGRSGGFNDHRMVMSLAVAGSASRDGVSIEGAEAINKTYPDFFKEFERLGGKLEWDA